MSMMINPAGGGQIIAAGQPFKLKMKKKRPEAAEPVENAEPAVESDEAPEADEDGDP